MLLLLALLAADKPALVQGVSGSSNPRLEAMAGGVVARQGAPGCAFATLRLARGRRTLPFLVLLRHGLGGGGKSESNEDVTLDDRKAAIKHALTLEGKTLVITHAVEVSTDSKVLKETLTLNGKPADPGKGRVFLVDLTVSPPKVDQKRLDLPADVGDLTAEKDASDFAMKVLADLAKQDKNVAAFLEGR
ncbi:MAG: hypothetical protein ACRC33_21665 [Gemmataceae bacterium]